jgi:hypothetical protein
VSLHEHKIRPIVRIQNTPPKVPRTSLATGYADIECPANHAITTSAGNCFTERAGLVNNLAEITGVEFIEILGFKPDLVILKSFTA